MAELSFFPKGSSGQLFAGKGGRLKFYDESDKFWARLGKKETRVFTLTGSDVRRAVRRSLVKKPRKSALARYQKALEDRREGRASSGDVRKARKLVVSKPGKPPLQHTGKLRDLVFYAYDRVRKTVVIGPVRFGSRSQAMEGKTGAELLETGGRIMIAGRRNRYRARVLARPYMEPQNKTAREAFKKHMGKEKL